MENQPEFMDPEQYSGKDTGRTFKELVLSHLAKISQICTSEFRPGYWNEKPVAVGGSLHVLKIYVEDKRDSYINSVDFLHDILLPHFDNKMNAQSELIEKELEEAYNKFKKEKKDKSQWTDEKLIIKRKLFQQLSLQLKRISYLKGKKFEYA